MSEESVKGSMLAYSVDAVRRLRDGGDVGGVEIEKSLSPETLELLEERILITNWYPMWQFNEIQDFLWEHLYRRNPEEARKVGAEWFGSMQASGRYPQYEYAGRADRASSKQEMVRQTRLIASILDLYYNFLDVEVGLDPDSGDLQVHFRNAGLFCETLRYTTEGFLLAISRIRKGTSEWTSERIAPDVILFTLPNTKNKA